MNARRWLRLVGLVAIAAFLGWLFWPVKQQGPPEDWQQGPVKQHIERAYQVPVCIGDRWVLKGDGQHGEQCIVREVFHQSDANGTVTFTKHNATLTTQEAPGVPIRASAGETEASWFLLESEDHPGQWQVGFWDPYFKAQIGGSGETVTGTIAETLTLCWTSPDITIYVNGVLQDGVTASFLVVRNMADGKDAEFWLGADKFRVVDTWSDTWGSWVAGNSRAGQWTTDQNGILRESAGDGRALAQIYFAKGGGGRDQNYPRDEQGNEQAAGYGTIGGALTQRAGDLLYAGGPKPREYLTQLRVYSSGVSANVVEGQPVTLNIRGGTINFTAGGMPTKFYAAFEDCQDPEYVGGDPPGSYFTNGATPLTGLRDGRWIVWCIDELTGNTKIWQRQRVEIANAGTVDVNLGNPIIGGDNGDGTVTIGGYVEDEPGRPLADAPLYYWQKDSPSPVAYLDIDGNPIVTGAGGGFEAIVLSAAWVRGAINSAWGYQRVWSAVPGTGYVDRIVLGACILFTEGGRWWDASERHNNVRDLAPVTIKRQEDGASFSMVPIPGGCRSEYMPRTPDALWEEYVDPIYQFTAPERYHYDIVGGAGVAISGFGTVQFGNSDLDWAAYGKLPDPPIVHGKVGGNVLLQQNTFQDRVKDNFPEAVREGLEQGLYEPGLRQIYTCTCTTGTYHFGSVEASHCGYCRGPVHQKPDYGSDYRGYCYQCTNVFGIGKAMDARTEFWSPPLPEAWTLTVQHQLCRAGEWRKVDTTYWPRPVDYAEDDTYLNGNGPGQPTNAPRWYFVHAILGTWQAGAFAQGETAAQIAADYPAITGQLLLQPKVEPFPGSVLYGPVTYRMVWTDRSGELHNTDFTIPTNTKGAGVSDAFGDLVFLAPDPPIVAEWTPSPWVPLVLVRSIDSMTCLNEEGDHGHKFRIVADGPALVVQNTPIPHGATSPYTCRLMWKFGEPDMAVDELTGVVHLVWADSGTVFYCQTDRDDCNGWRWADVPTPNATVEHQVYKRIVFANAEQGGQDHDSPAITQLSDGTLLVCARRVGAGMTDCLKSANQGKTWEGLT